MPYQQRVSHRVRVLTCAVEQTVQSVLIILMLYFNPIVTKTFAVLNCTEVGGVYVVATAMDVRSGLWCLLQTALAPCRD